MEWTDAKPRKFGAVTPWFVLLAISLLINYVDRGNLSLAAPLLKNELHLTALATWDFVFSILLDLHCAAICHGLGG